MLSHYNSVIIRSLPPSFFPLRCVLSSDENGKEELFPVKDLISRFRANIITKGTRAFEEEKWDEISIGSLHFQVSSGKFSFLPQTLPMEIDLNPRSGWWRVGIPRVL